MEVTKERKRDGGIPAPAWWPIRAAAAKADRGLRLDQIATSAARLLGVDTLDQSRVSRCLSGSTATIPLLDAISTVLGIPSPVYLAETETEASSISVALAASRRQAAALAAADVAIERELASNGSTSPPSCADSVGVARVYALSARK